MATKIYNKFLKEMVKDSDLFITRTNDQYYITNGFIAFQCSNYFYDEIVSLIHANYIRLNNNETALRRNKHDPMKIEKEVHGIVKLMDNFKSSGNELKNTNIVFIGNNKQLINIFINTNNNSIMAANKKYIDGALEITNTLYTVSNKNIDPLIYNDECIKLIILPIKLNGCNFSDSILEINKCL